MQWLNDRDLNTNFFHAKASQRVTKNKIDGIKNNDGRWLYDDNEIRGHVDDYFRTLFTSY